MENFDINKEIKERLSLEQQAKLEKLRHLLPSLRSFLQERNRILPIIASLSITLLIVFSFDRGLIPIADEELKILITILLIVVPVSLVVHLFDNQAAINQTFKSIKEVIGGDPLSQNTWERILGSFMTFLSWVIVFLITLVIGYVVYSLWW